MNHLSEDLLRAHARIRELEEMVKNLSYKAFVDEMTGIPNFRAFQQRLDTLVAEAERGRSFCLVMADLDNFKSVNDACGHPFGDDVLRHFASILHRVARKVDFVGRYGGEEFVMLLPDCTFSGAQVVAERVRQTLESEPYGCVQITASFGVCQYRTAMTATDLIRYTDAALYDAKATGRNTVKISRVCA